MKNIEIRFNNSSKVTLPHAPPDRVIAVTVTEKDILTDTVEIQLETRQLSLIKFPTPRNNNYIGAPLMKSPSFK